MTNYDKMYALLVQKGMQNKIAKLFVKKFKIDEDSYKCSEETRKWAMEKGFFPSMIDFYGLDENNYKYFLPDYVDFMLHPYNNHFVIWINDKLSLKYTLGKQFDDIMPEYYLYIENNGEYTYLQDTPSSIPKDKDFILNLLREKKVLIIKPNSSKSGGEGVMKVVWIEGDKICINNKEIVSTIEFQRRTANLENYIITEYAYQHHNLQKIWPDSECTLRVVMIKLPKKDKYVDYEWKCIMSFARFGTSISGGTSNLSCGGIGVGFDFYTGKLKELGLKQIEFCTNGESNCLEHPDTHFAWAGETLPNWEYVRDTLYKICNHYSSLNHLGFDVIITEKGFIICEINSKPAINVGQVTNEPFLMSDDIRDYFMSKGLAKIDCSELYEIYKQSQE